MGNELATTEKQRPTNPLSLAPVTNQGLPATVVENAHKAAAEVLSRVMTARADKRDEKDFERDMVKLCNETYFAEKAIYAVDVGKGNIAEGPSVYLAREMAKRYRNFEYDIVDHGMAPDTKVLQYEVWAWDYEHNTRGREVVSLTVPNWASANEQKLFRFSGSYKAKTTRNVIFSLMPQHVIEKCTEAALNKCQTIAEQTTEKKDSFVAQMSERFGIPPAELCKFVGKKKVGDLGSNEVRRLIALRQAMLQGEIDPKDLFKDAKTIEEATAPKQAKTDKKPSDKEKPKKDEKPKDTKAAEKTAPAPKPEPEPPPEEEDEAEEAAPDDDDDAQDQEDEEDQGEDDEDEEGDDEPDEEEKKPAPTKPRKRW